MTSHQSGPIFIHAMFRTGSTYLFNAFRRSPGGYWCYQEPEHEYLAHLDGHADNLLKMADDTADTLRHPTLGKPYFFELYQIKDALQGLFRKSFSYDDFFMPTPPGLDPAQQRYFSALIDNAQGRPVLQFCRSAGRIAALKQAFGGVHIHLWREPRNQWWSFKIADYFDAALQMIYNARALPPVLREVKQISDITVFHSDDILQEQQHAINHPLAAAANYQAFYALWLYALMEGEQQAEVSIAIDRLSVDPSYRADTLAHLARFGIEQIDFSDCTIPCAVFTQKDEAFFAGIEDRMADLFLAHGYDQSRIAACLAIGARHTSSASASSLPATSDAPALIRDAARAREIALRSYDQIAQAQARAAYAEACAQRDEAQARQAEEQAQRAEAHARQAEEQAQRDQAHARQAEEQAQRAEAHARQAEEQAQRDQAHARQAEEHVQRTEAHARRVEAHAQQVETHARNLQSECDAGKTLLEQRERDLAELNHLLALRLQELQSIYASKAWRMTLPLRWLNQQRIRLKTKKTDPR